MRRPPRVTTRRSERLRLRRLLDQRERLGTQRIEVGTRAAGRRRSARGARSGRRSANGRPPVDAHHLEPAVAAQQPVVGEGGTTASPTGVIAPSTLASHMVVAAWPGAVP